MQPQTSLASNRKAEQTGMKLTHAEMVLQALSIRKLGNYEEIAMFCNLTPLQVVRRLKELETAGKIERTGKTSKTFSGDQGEIWRLVTTQSQQEVQQKLFN